VYTTIGGFRAVVWTDMLQGLVMLVGVVVLLVLALTHVGGLSRATQALSEMTPPRLGEIEFVLPEPADATIAIPTDTWLWIRADGESEDRLVRTNQAALVPVGSDISNRVRATEITGAKEIERVASMPGFAVGTPEGAVPRIIASREYAFGAGRRGVYVTAPGPSAEDATGFLPIGLAFSFFVYWALSGTGQPGNLVRLMAFKDSVTMKRGIAALAVFFSMIYFPLVIIFCCARLIVPGLDHTPDRIMPVLSYELTSSAGIPWMAGLLIAAPFAAAMSTVDSFMLIISSAFVRDIYQREFRPHASERIVKGMSYACTVLVGAVALIGSLDPPRFLQYVVVFAGGALSVAFLAPVALGLYWERFNRAGALSAVCGGVLVYLGLYFAGFVKYGGAIPVRPLGLDPLIWGFAASLAGAWAGVRWGLPVSPEIRRRFFS
jgi:Na+/pantothenate symporter